jgi:hypothetical protein
MLRSPLDTLFSMTLLSGALATTLAATRRELDACEARLIAVLDEQSHLRAAGPDA